MPVSVFWYIENCLEGPCYCSGPSPGLASTCSVVSCRWGCCGEVSVCTSVLSRKWRGVALVESQSSKELAPEDPRFSGITAVGSRVLCEAGPRVLWLMQCSAPSLGYQRGTFNRRSTLSTAFLYLIVQKVFCVTIHKLLRVIVTV